MINKILRVFTGYKTRTITEDGFEIKISYVGKFPATSPLAFLKELNEKISMTPNENVNGFDFKAQWESRLAGIKDVLPSCSSKFQIANTNYKISRYVSKQNKSPLSIYTYSENEKVFAFFSRLYDYGIYFNEIESELISSKQIKKSDLDIHRYFISHNQYSAIFDVFGHTQLFIWNDQAALYRLLNRIALPKNP